MDVSISNFWLKTEIMVFFQNMCTDFCLAYLGFAVIEKDNQVNYLNGIQQILMASFCIAFNLDFLKCEEESEFHGDLLSLMILVISLAQVAKKLQYTLTITHSSVVSLYCPFL